MDGTVRISHSHPVRVYEKDQNGVLSHASLWIDGRRYSGPLFENAGEAEIAVREWGDPDTNYVILTVRPN